MRTTVNLDDELLAKARRLSGITEHAALVNEAIRALIQRKCLPWFSLVFAVGES